MVAASAMFFETASQILSRSDIMSAGSAAKNIYPSHVRGVGWVGLEPTTNALKGRCSTIELPTRSGRDTFLIQFDQCRKVAGMVQCTTWRRCPGNQGAAVYKPPCSDAAQSAYERGAGYRACLRRQSAVATTKRGRFGKRPPCHRAAERSIHLLIRDIRPARIATRSVAGRA